METVKRDQVRGQWVRMTVEIFGNDSWRKTLEWNLRRISVSGSITKPFYFYARWLTTSAAKLFPSSEWRNRKEASWSTLLAFIDKQQKENNFYVAHCSIFTFYLYVEIFARCCRRLKNKYLIRVYLRWFGRANFQSRRMETCFSRLR